MTPTDADPAAAELARCVAWLRARRDKLYAASSEELDRNYALSYRLKLRAIELANAAMALARGEEP